MFFPLGLSNFWVGAWFPFDEGQFNDSPDTFEGLEGLGNSKVF